MPPDEQSLRDAAAALRLPLSDVQVGQLLRYLALLQHWNATYNLTAVRDPQAMLTQHVVDCMAAVPSLQRWAATRAAAPRILDVGSGGGLPGLVWATLLPEARITCIDAVGKKAAFVRQAAGTLGLAAQAVHGRVEALRLPPFDLVTSRAFASLADFVRLTDGALAEDGVWLALKGKLPGDEMAALPGDFVVFHVEPITVPGLAAERCLVWLKRAPPT